MDYKNGDTITLEHPNGSKLVGKVEGEVMRVDANYAHTISIALHHDFKVTHVEPAPVPLPTEPGLYIPRNNAHILGSSTVWRLKGGEWKALNNGGGLGHEYAHNNLGGLVRLVPEA